MEKYIGKYAPYLFAILRIVAGLMFMLHGVQKLVGFPGNTDPVELFSLMGLAGIIEFAGGLLITFGLFTSFVAFIACGEMATAYFMAHAPQGWHPVLNKGELAILYCFLFLYIAAHGSGIWSIDKLRNKI